VEYIGASVVLPAYPRLFIPYDLEYGLEGDSLAATHPITTPASELESEDTINEIFDSITYSKGACILRMIHSYLDHDDDGLGLGQGSFFDGIRSYLAAHTYGNTQAEDLLQAWSGAANEDISSNVQPWLDQPGFPLVTVRATGSGKCGEGSQGYEISQSPYLEGPQYRDDRWWVPLPYSSNGGQYGWITLEPQPSSPEHLCVPASDEAEDEQPWLMVNAEGSSFVRVVYEAEETWQGLMGAVTRAFELNVEDVDVIIGDAFALALRGREGYTIRALEAAAALGARSLAQKDMLPLEYGPWLLALDGIVKVQELLAQSDGGEECETALELYFQKNVLTRPLSIFALEAGALDDVRLLRGKLTMAQVRLGMEADQFRMEATAMFANRHATRLHPDIAETVYTLVAGTSAAAYGELVEIYRSAENDPQERVRALKALAYGPTTEAQLQETLELAFSPEVRYQDAYYVWAYASANPFLRDARSLVWATLTARTEELLARAGGSKLPVCEDLARVARGFATREWESRVAAFFDAHPEVTVERTRDLALEHIRRNAEYVEAAAPETCDFLARAP